MKRIMCRFTYPTPIVVAVALLALVVLTSPSLSRAASSEPGAAGACRVSKVDRAEARVKELHIKLQITPAQEEQWNKVAQVIRDNAKTMEGLIKERSEKANVMTAVEDLKSYGAIAEAHADGINKFLAVFEPLYAGMSDLQKKNADLVFHHHGHGHRNRAK